MTDGACAPPRRREFSRVIEAAHKRLEDAMKNLTEDEKRDIEAEAFKLLSRFAEIVGDATASPEALVVATAAQSLLALRYFASERKDDVMLAITLGDVGVQMGEMVHREALQLQREAKHGVN